MANADAGCSDGHFGNLRFATHNYRCCAAARRILPKLAVAIAAPTLQICPLEQGAAVGHTRRQIRRFAG